MKRKLALLFVLIVISFFPLIAMAATGAEILPNPMKCNDLICLFMTVIRILLGAVGTFALFIFMWGGFLMITSAGNPESIKKAKDALLWASIGIITILASWAIIQYIMKVIVDSTV